MKDISDAVLQKVREEAEARRRAAEAEAEKELEAARRRREQRLEAKRRRALAEADHEAARIVAQATMQARNAVAAAKAEVIEKIVARARKALASQSARPESLAVLLAEAVAAIGSSGELRLGVAKRDLAAAREHVESDESLASRVGEVVERPIGGGVVIETSDGALMVDNSHEARLQMLVPRILARLGRELFEEA